VAQPNDFASTTELRQTLLAFTDRYNQTARPFNWKFTADDLTCFAASANTSRSQPPPARQPI
jgi:hypothetical protein